ncbi:unnamed protein product [Rhizopus stolonifer]
MLTRRAFAEKAESNDRSILKNLPQELWSIIYSHLTISELFILSKTCRWQHYYITNQPVWRWIARVADLGVPKYKYKTYCELVQSKANRICEYCYKIGRPSGCQAILSIKTILKPKEPLVTIRLCLDCRIKAHVDGRIEENQGMNTIVYESYWNCDKSQEYIDYPDIKLYFSMDWKSLKGLPCAGKRYLLNQVIERARRIYGGDVGIEARQLAKDKRLKALTKTMQLKKGPACIYPY